MNYIECSRCRAVVTNILSHWATEHDRYRVVKDWYWGTDFNGQPVKLAHGGFPGIRHHFCDTCENVTLSCAECERLFTRKREWVLARYKSPSAQGRYTGDRFYCSRSCSGRVMGRTHGLGNPEHPTPRMSS